MDEKEVLNGYVIDVAMWIGHKRVCFGIAEDQTTEYPYICFTNGCAVVTLCMETDEVCFALCGVVKTKTSKLAVSRVDIVKVDVFNRCCDNLASCNHRCRKKEEC